MSISEEVSLEDSPKMSQILRLDQLRLDQLWFDALDTVSLTVCACEHTEA